MVLKTISNMEKYKQGSCKGFQLKSKMFLLLTVLQPMHLFWLGFNLFFLTYCWAFIKLKFSLNDRMEKNFD